mgnify:CR=1 FL=1
MKKIAIGWIQKSAQTLSNRVNCCPSSIRIPLPWRRWRWRRRPTDNITMRSQNLFLRILIFSMAKSSKSLARRTLEVAISFVPWVISMYTLYWLESGEIWTTDTPHRGKTSVTILVAGMVLTLLVYSYFSKREQK